MKDYSKVCDEASAVYDEASVREYGLGLGKTLNPGSVIALIGEPGAGKTTLTKAIAEGLGIRETVTSPTFNIVKEYYSGRLPMYHFDVYRIGDVSEMYEIGYEEYFFGSGVSIVEWADRIEEIIPDDGLVIRIDYGANRDERVYRWKY